MAANANIENNASNTNAFFRSAQSSVGTAVASTISTPPIVGVPAFAWCACGPALRMNCPICSSRSLRITHGPSTIARNSAVRLAYAVRTVM